MADIGKTVKEIWEQGMKAVNKAATNIATSTKQKVDEMNIVTRRKELQNQLGLRLYELWQAGEDVPETLKATLEEMRDLEVKLQELRESKTTAPEDEKSAETPDSAAHAPDTTDVKVPLEDDDVPTIAIKAVREQKTAVCSTHWKYPKVSTPPTGISTIYGKDCINVSPVPTQPCNHSIRWMKRPIR